MNILESLSKFLLIFASVVSFGFLVSKSVQADEPQIGFVYEHKIGNQTNQFVLAPKGFVSGARYFVETFIKDQFGNTKVDLNGQPVMALSSVHLDRLTYVKDVQFNDGKDGAPQVVRGWLYKGTDKSKNSWEIIFGKDQSPVIQDTYPIYFRYPKQANFTRWKTIGGTKRKASKLDSNVLAILWANQLEPDELGLTPFDPNRTNPMIPNHNWKSIAPELQQLLSDTEPGDFSYLLVKNSNGRHQMDLDMNPNTRKKLARIFPVTFDFDRAIQFVPNAAARFSSKQLRREIFQNGTVNYSTVVNIMEASFGNKANKNSQFIRKIGNDGCSVTNEDWQYFCKDNRKSYFWRLILKFEEAEQDDRFSLSCWIAVGEAENSEAMLGQEYIYPKFESEDFAEVKKTVMGTTGRAHHVDTAENRLVSLTSYRSDGTAVSGLPAGVTGIPLPSISGTMLDAAYRQNFQAFIARMTQK